MKKSLIALAALSLAGCAGTFGHTTYSVKANAAGGYDLDASDGKEYAQGRAFLFDAKNGTVAVQEGPSKSFKGQAIGAKALSVMPVTGLQDLVK